jgi:hypothetical protein
LLGAVLEKTLGHSGSSRKIGAQAAATIKNFLLQHFSNAREFHNFTLYLSIGLIVIGVVFCLLGWKWMAHKPDRL